jgi:hypothetical protein
VHEYGRMPRAEDQKTQPAFDNARMPTVHYLLMSPKLPLMGKAGKQSCLLSCFVDKACETDSWCKVVAKRHCVKSLGHWALHYFSTAWIQACIGQQTWMRLTHTVGMLGNKETTTAKYLVDR